MKQWRTYAARGLLAAALVGCSSDSGDDADAPEYEAAPADAAPPALVATDCPGTPTDLTLNLPAPVWGGVAVLEVTVPGGTPDGLDLALFDPSTGTWTASGASTSQREDGRYVLTTTPALTEQSKDAEFRLRVRSRLQGCPPSDWTESDAFTLGDPLTGTTWTGSWDPSSVTSNVAVTRSEVDSLQPLPTLSPELVGPIEHTLSFNADGSLDETYAFELASLHEDEPFDGCSLLLHYTGSWHYAFAHLSLNLVLSERVPTADPTRGSSCANPKLGSLAVNDDDPSGNQKLDAALVPLNIDYTGLLSSPPASAELDSFQLVVGLSSTLEHASYETADEIGTVSGFVSPLFASYLRQ